MHHVWNQWFSDVTLETLQEMASLTSNGTTRTGCDNKTSRRASPSLIPSLFELASSSFKILKEFNSRSKVTPSVTGEVKDDASPLSTPAEVRFCDSVIAECEGPVGEVQRRCAVNYKQWIMLRSAPCSFECNGVTLDERATTTTS